MGGGESEEETVNGSGGSENGLLCITDGTKGSSFGIFVSSGASVEGVKVSIAIVDGFRGIALMIVLGGGISKGKGHEEAGKNGFLHFFNYNSKRSTWV